MIELIPLTDHSTPLTMNTEGSFTHDSVAHVLKRTSTQTLN